MRVSSPRFRYRRRPLVFAKSPIQLFLSVTHIRERGLPEPIVVALTSPQNIFQYYDPIERLRLEPSDVIYLNRWPVGTRMRLQYLVAIFGALMRSGRPIFVAVGGDINSDSRWHIMIASVLQVPTIFVENGLGTLRLMERLAVADQQPQGRQTRTENMLRRVAPESSVISLLPRSAFAKGQRHRCIAASLGSLSVNQPVTPGAWFVGQPLNSVGYLSDTAYVQLVERTVGSLLPGMPAGAAFVYLAHPSERSNSLTQISHIEGCTVLHPSSAIEFWCTEATSRPTHVVSPFSSALVSLGRIVGPGTQFYRWPDDTLLDAPKDLAGPLREARRILDLLGVRTLELQRHDSDGPLAPFNDRPDDPPMDLMKTD